MFGGVPIRISWPTGSPSRKISRFIFEILQLLKETQWIRAVEYIYSELKAFLLLLGWHCPLFLVSQRQLTKFLFSHPLFVDETWLPT